MPEKRNEIEKEFKKVEDFMKITKIEDDKYAVTLEGGNTTERTFAKKIRGPEICSENSHSQSLNADRFLSVTNVKEAAHLHQKNEKLLNERVGKYVKEKR